MKKISIVYQTHWDREWYLNVDTYNIRLKKVMRQIISLLSRDVIDSFVLDGQVKALEDYFDICEEFERNEVLKYLQNGRLIIGPWYVLSDEFLVSGESIVRNLEVGMEISKEYSDYQNIGYLPDTFGHVSQMPQIFNQYGINSAILWRGVLPEDTFFNWNGENNSNVFVVFLKEGYYQPIVDQANYQALMNTYVNKYNDFTDYENILLTNGGDHLSPSFGDITSNISELEKEFGIEIESTSYEKYIDTVENKSDFQNIKGELRDNQNCYVLPNVLSTRYYLKQQNMETESNIRKLEALVAKNYHSKPYYYQKMIDNVWKEFMLNHPHDSICGCSIDDVHTEMETRTMKINHTIENLIKNEMIEMDAYPDRLHYVDNDTKIFDDYEKFSIYNPTVRTINEFRKVKIYVNKENTLVDQFVVTEGNTTYTTYILSKKETRIFEVPLDYFPEFRGVYEYEIVFRVKDLKGLTSNTYTLKQGNPIVLNNESRDTIENDLLSVEAVGSALRITDKVNSTVYENINEYVSSLDNGDEYNYSKPEFDQLMKASLIDSSVKVGDYYQEMNLKYRLLLPSGLDETRSKGTQEQVENLIDVKVSIYSDRRTIDFDVKYVNNAKDQRTRVLFDLNKTVENHYSDTAFDIVKREYRKEEFKALKQKEVPVCVDPSLSLIETDDLRINHVGIQEYQLSRGETDTIEMTLMRSVGFLSRDDLASRGGGAGPSFPTMDSQMIGEYTYKYQLVLKDTDFANNDVFKEDVVVTKGHVNDLGSYLTIEAANVFVSSLRKKEDYSELRLYNPSDKKLNYGLKSIYDFDFEVVDLLGNTLDLDVYSLKPKEIKTLRLRVKEMPSKEVDVVVAGGSIGGVLAAKKLCDQGYNVLLTEETDWIGGQLTNQAVPLDEHPFIEEFGCTKLYREFRNNARKYYQNMDLKEEFKNNERLNPGGAWVSRLAFEPKVALKLFEEMLNPYLGNNLEIVYQVKPVSSEVVDDEVNTLYFEHMNTLNLFKVKAKYVIDATELGDTLKATNTEYVTGSEGDTYGEIHGGKRDPYDMQPVTHVISLEWNNENKELIEKPKNYDFYKNYKMPYDDFMVLSEYGPDSSTGKARKFNTVDGRMPLWSYRKFYDANKFEQPLYNDLTTINWPQNDYFMGNIFDDEFEDIHKEEAKELTKSFVYYLQNEVKRHDGGTGYHEMKVAKEHLGTNDGLAMYPYIRESRRIKALKTITEQDISGKTNKEIPTVSDSIGVGCYHIDLHITTKSNEFFFDNTWPFEIPLSSLIPIRMKNIIPACKNIGTTHLTNGSFRLHPVEWNIGESAGLLIAYSLSHNVKPIEITEDKRLLKDFQRFLVDNGIELHWPKDKVRVI